MSFAEPPGESKLGSGANARGERRGDGARGARHPAGLRRQRGQTRGRHRAAERELPRIRADDGAGVQVARDHRAGGGEGGRGGAGHQRAGSGGISAAVSPQAGRGSGAATPTFGRPAGAEDDDTPQGGGTMPRTGSAFGLASGGGGEEPTRPPVRSGIRPAAALRNWRARVRKDEMWFLERLIRRKFDPRRVDAAKGRPAWMQRLLVSDRGRAVLFSLAEAHPNCLLITIAIQHAWQHGHVDEVRALGPATASYFSISHELLAEHSTAPSRRAADEDRRADAVDVIKRACTQSLATYLFAQMMLADLARGGDAGLGGGSSKAVSRPGVQGVAGARGGAAATHGSSTVRKIAPSSRSPTRTPSRPRSRGTSSSPPRRRGGGGGSREPPRRAALTPRYPQEAPRALPGRTLRRTPSLRRRAWVRPPGWRLRVRTRTRARGPARIRFVSPSSSGPSSTRLSGVTSAPPPPPTRAARSRARSASTSSSGPSPTAGKTRRRRRDGRWRARQKRSRRRLEGRRQSPNRFAVWSGTRPRRLA